MIIIFGPTGVGKTDFSLQLASHIKAEIINMDMGSFYTPLIVGTAKPDWRSYPIPHHLFDILDIPTNYTIAQYRADVQRLIQEIKARGNTPLLVGGSGFYLKSLFFMPAQTSVLHDQKYITQKSNDELWQELHTIDPERAAQLHPNDRYRVERALTIWYTSGKKASEQAPEYNPVDDNTTIIWVAREREELYERINQRVDTMMDAGLLAEVESLKNSDWVPFLEEKKIIGYDDLLQYLKGSVSLKDAIATIKTKSRNYAKRQIIFWRMLEKLLPLANQQSSSPILLTMQTLNLTLTDLELYIKQLTHV